MKVSIGTSVYRTLVVWDDQSNRACINVTDCAVSRGGLFAVASSSTWRRNNASFPRNTYPMSVDRQLGYASSAGFGFDNVSLAGAGNSLTNQSVGAFFATDIFL